jgi:glycosyltransferase involved in cell wall biosynthesis
MRIAYVVSRSDTLGGSLIHVRDCYTALKNKGHEAVIIVGGNGPFTKHLQDRGINFISIKNLSKSFYPPNDINAYKELKNVLANYAPDIISTHSAKARLLCSIIAKKLNIPLLCTAHGWSFSEGRPFLSQKLAAMLENIAAKKSKKIITVSEYDKKIALQKLSVDKNKIITIYNGMPDIPKNYCADPAKSDPVNITMIARMDDQKDHITLIKALSKIDGYHLKLVGDGPNMKSIQKLAKQTNTYSKITFCGRLDSVDGILSESQIFVLISNWEGFPRSTIEAMRAGLPVIVSDVGGAAEAVQEGVNGYSVKRGDVQDLTQKLSKLIKNAEMRVEMGKNSRNYYEKELRFDIMFEKTFNLYKDCINDKNSKNEMNS